MATMKTLKFPGSSNVYEMVDATARAGVASLQTAVDGLVDDTLATSGKAADAAAVGAALNEKADNTDVAVLSSREQNADSGVVSGYAAKPLPYMISAANKWISQVASHIMIPVAPGDVVVVEATTAQPAHYAVLRSFDVPAANATPDFSTVSGFTARVTVTKDTRATFTAPSDAAYVSVTNIYNSITYAPESVRVNGIEMLSSLRGQLAKVQSRIGIFQSLNLTEIKRDNPYYDASGRKYQAQCLAVTDDYIVVGMNSVNTTEFPNAYNLYNAFLALDKTTLEPANITPNPVILDFENGGYTIASSHANNMSFVASTNELWIRSTVNSYAIVLDADTLALKTFVQMPYSGTFGYDNENGKWCFMQDVSNNSNKYYIRVFESTRTSQINALTAWKQGTTQGCEFYDDAVFFANSSVGNRVRGESLTMIDASTGILLADWWFGSADEFEDVSFIDDQIVLLTARGNGYSILTGSYKPYNQHPSNMLSYINPWNSTITTELVE